MGIFTRIKDIVSSNINALLDKVEDPEKMRALSIRKLEDAVSGLKDEIRKKTEELEEAEKRIKEEREALSRWTERARMAARAGKDNLAREAIMEKLLTGKRIRSDEHLIDALSSVIPALKDTLGKAERKLGELREESGGFRIRAEGLRARRKAENAASSDWEARIAEMEARIRKEEEKATTAGSFEEMERDEEIEKELERLRKEAFPSASGTPL